jgi:hypothetical protein
MNRLSLGKEKEGKTQWKMDEVRWSMTNRGMLEEYCRDRDMWRKKFLGRIKRNV